MMDIVLIILGVLGLGAIVIAAYVFTVSARNYVSNDIHTDHVSTSPANRGGFAVRGTLDRRRSIPAQFPITVNGALVSRDRREAEDRRAA